jgi:16S rRNA (guanine527-N7)-methyltransferase
MTPELFRAKINVSRETLARLKLYEEILRRWQPKINLVSQDSLDALWTRHMLDSAQLIEHIPSSTNTITDLGSGAGFPGLVIAIITGVKMHLVESDSRKSAFLREVIRQTEAPAEIHNGRAEDIAPWSSDIVTARALAPLTKLLAYAAPFLRPPSGSETSDGSSICLFLKGAAWRDELTEAQKSWHIQCQDVVSITDPMGRILIIKNPTPNSSGEKLPR